MKFSKKEEAKEEMKEKQTPKNRKAKNVAMKHAKNAAILGLGFKR